MDLLPQTLPFKQPLTVSETDVILDVSFDLRCNKQHTKDRPMILNYKKNCCQ